MERSTIIAGLASGMLVLVAGAGAVAAVGSLQDASQESLAIGQAQPQASIATTPSMQPPCCPRRFRLRPSRWPKRRPQRQRVDQPRGFVGLRVKFGLVG